MKKILRYFLWLILFIVLSGCIWALFHHELVGYGYGQLKGQLHIVWNARPVDAVMKDPAVPDSIRRKLLFMEEIKRFAIDSLGLQPTSNYTTFFDQQGKPLLWVLTAAEPFAIKAYHWRFPWLGEVSYKGFFKKEAGLREDSLMRSLGYDTDFGEVSAWSTLGWFRDPILSGMLNRREGQLAELLIHEMTHATLYVKSDVDFNENLASFMGEQGAIVFLKNKFGNTSVQLTDYLNRKEDYDLLSRHMLRGSVTLDSLYSKIKSLPLAEKKELKASVIDSIISSMDTVSFHRRDYFKKVFAKEKPNNAYFINFIRYDAKKEEMKKEMEKYSGNDFRKYMDYLKKKYR